MDNITTICAIERDGLDIRILSISIHVQKDKIKTKEDVIHAIKAACNEYIHTYEGQKTYEHNCNNFNWADFDVHVPNSICRRHGFAKIDSMLSTIERNWDEQLAERQEEQNE